MKELPTFWPGVLFGVALGILAAFQQFKLPPMLPILFDQYGYSKLLAGSFMSIYAGVGLIASIAIGKMLAGGKLSRLLAAAFTLFLAGNSIAMIIPQHGLAMLGSRFMEGIAFAIMAVVGTVLASGNANARHRPVAIGLWATWIPVGQVLGSLGAIPLTRLRLWRPLWLTGMFATMIMAMWGYRLVKSGRLVVPGGTSEASPGVVTHDSGRTRKLLFLSGALFTLWSSQYIALATWLPQYMVEVRSFTPSRAAALYLIPPLLVITFNMVGGKMLQRGWSLGLLLTSTLVVETLVWLAVPHLGTGPLGLVALLAYGMACGITATCLFALPTTIMGGNGDTSAGFAAIMTGRNLGALVGPILLAQATVYFGGWNTATYTFFAITASAVAVSVLLSAGLKPLNRKTL
jgi:predicted MFS family arabinose efflux permease